MDFSPRFLILFFLFSLPGLGWAQHLECSPCAHHFGEVAVGNSASFTFQLENSGTKALTIHSITEQSAEFTLGKLELPIKINPGATLDVPVTFTPTTVGHVNGGLKVTSTVSPMTLVLGGTGHDSRGGGAQLTATPPTLNFGKVPVGTTVSVSLNLTASKGKVTISSDKTTNPEFVITGLKTPVTIQSGESLTVTVQFTPTKSGATSGKCDFVSNAEKSPLVERISGTGYTEDSVSVSLNWNAGGGSVAGYNIYRGAKHGGPYNQLNSSLLSATDYTDYDVVAGDTYYYVATEVNMEGQESGYSNEAKAQVPQN
jgi:Abnormal spindle-like microcephaly-assoc'd, ASPM-SPD-2-Hydin/Protein of unknown function (DUF1573)